MKAPDIDLQGDQELTELFSNILALHFRWDVEPPTEKQLITQVAEMIEEYVKAKSKKRK